jgi:non-heme chloroperoxidase
MGTSASSTAVGISPAERAQIQRANVSGLHPVVFVHGLWLLSGSWQRWAEAFEEAGYIALTPDWPGDPASVAEANANPAAMANKTVGQVADHFSNVIAQLERKPAVVGHSFGGLLAQILAGRGLSAVTVAIDPAPFRGVLPLPLSALKAAWPVLGNPANRSRAVPLTHDQFRYAFANAVSEDEARELYRTYAVPAPGAPLFQAAAANVNPWTEAQVDTQNHERGPLLIVSGQKDHTVPWAIANASFKQQQINPGLTEIVEMPNRGHSLVIDSGWREVADTALAFVRRFAMADAFESAYLFSDEVDRRVAA